MNTFSNISSELKSFFSTNKFFRLLLPVDMILLFAGLIIMLLGDFGVNFGNFLGGLSYWLFISGLLLAFANGKERILYIGLFCYAALELFVLLRNLISYGNFYWGYIFSLLVYGGLGYAVLRRTFLRPSSAGHDTQDNIGQ